MSGHRLMGVESCLVEDHVATCCRRCTDSSGIVFDKSQWGYAYLSFLPGFICRATGRWVLCLASSETMLRYAVGGAPTLWDCFRQVSMGECMPFFFTRFLLH